MTSRRFGYTAAILLTTSIAALLGAFFTRSVTAEELPRLAKEYQVAKGRLGGTPEQRAQKLKEFVLPVATQIAALDTDDAISFLARELKDPIPDVVAMASVLLVEFGHPKALLPVLRGFGRRAPLARLESWKALAKLDKTQLRGVQKELLGIARKVKALSVKRYVAVALGKVGSVAAAKTLLLLVRHVHVENKDSAEEIAYSTAVVKALSSDTGDSIEKWLGKSAFKVAGKAVGKLLVVTDLVRQHRVTKARPRLLKNVSHRSSEVAASSLDALAAIGVRERDVDKIAALIKKRKGSRHAHLRIRALLVLGSVKHEAALAVVRECLSDRDTGTRAVAIECVARMADKEEALPLLVAGLMDKAQSVRVNALRSLGRIQDKAVIGPLIDMLNEGEAHRLRVEALRYLVSFTGNNMGLEIVDWRKWWETAEDSFHFEKETAGNTQVVMSSVNDLSYFGIEVSSDRITFVVDISGSMRQTILVDPENPGGESATDEGEAESAEEEAAAAVEEEESTDDKLVERRRIDVLKTELVGVLEKLSEEAYINIVLFDGTVRPWQKRLQRLVSGGREKAIDFVKSIKTGSGTNVYDSLELIMGDDRVDTIYMLTDGQPTRGKIRDPEKILKEIRVLNLARGLTIHCISIGEEEEEEEARGFLKRLADEHGGQYRAVGKVLEKD